jgi:hypothetical protein
MTSNNPMPNRVRDALERVLAYAMPDEASHYENTPTEQRSNHIYEALVTVGEWLDSVSS